MRIGITGYARAGKDEVAKVLVNEYGFTKVNMSDALHEAMMALNPIVHGVAFEEYGDQCQPDHLAVRQFRYNDAIRSVGYDEAKDTFPEVRELLQRLGTEVGRALDPNIWVNALNKRCEGITRVVTTGIRFPNEVDPLDVLIGVFRPGVGPVNEHASDQIDDIMMLADYTINNNGTLDNLADMTRLTMRRVGLR